MVGQQCCLQSCLSLYDRQSGLAADFQRGRLIDRPTDFHAPQGLQRVKTGPSACLFEGQPVPTLQTFVGTARCESRL